MHKHPNLTKKNHWIAVSPPEPDRTGSLLDAELGRESEVKFSGRKKKFSSSKEVIVDIKFHLGYSEEGELFLSTAGR